MSVGTNIQTVNFNNNVQPKMQTNFRAQSSPVKDYPITITPDNNGTYDIDLTPYTPDVQNGSIIVPPDSPTITVTPTVTPTITVTPTVTPTTTVTPTDIDRSDTSAPCAVVVPLCVLVQ